MTGFPEGLETRHTDAALSRLVTGEVIQMSQPFHFRPPFGELCAEAQALGEQAIDIVICSSLPNRFDGFLHGEVEAVAGCRAYIIAFQRRCTGEHNVRTPRRGGPPRLVDDDGFRLLPCTQEAVQILDFVEGIATAPVDQPDVWIGQPATIKIKGGTRIQQHIAAPRRRDIRLHRIGTDRQVRYWQSGVRIADASCRAITEPKAPAREPDLT